VDVQKLEMDKVQAGELYTNYLAHRGQMTADDRAIAAIYKRIAAGKLVIRALASITAAGLNAAGQPKLAIARADEKEIDCHIWNDGCRFEPRTRGNVRARDRIFSVSIPGMSTNTRNCRAVVPLIPVHLRPRKAIAKYHVLWEAEWNSYPVDPYLLRRFGEDAWLVVASWDLTPVERAVMSSKLNA
jgi:hypothetical protein